MAVWLPATPKRRARSREEDKALLRSEFAQELLAEFAREDERLQPRAQPVPRRQSWDVFFDSPRVAQALLITTEPPPKSL